jgi:transcriptional regulator GlxA family with amidase domain
MNQTTEPHNIDFLLVENFSMISFAAAIEPLRIANKLLGKRQFNYRCVSVDGKPVFASNGLPMQTGIRIEDTERPDQIVVCASDNVETLQLPPGIGACLRRFERHDTQISAICTGSFLLAEFGILRDRECTIHWEYEKVFSERFPLARLRNDIVVEDSGLLTCCGGTAPIELMIRMIGRMIGDDFSRAVAEIAIHHDIRDDSVNQRYDLRTRLNVSNSKFLECVRAMESNIENPVTSRQLSAQLGLSLRQIQRMFRKYTGIGPIKYYTNLRLEAARTFLRRSPMGINEIAVATGFTSHSHFARIYRNHFGVSPREDRIIPLQEPGQPEAT